MLQNLNIALPTEAETLIICDACGDFEDKVTHELMASYGFEVDTGENFSPVTKRELEFCSLGEMINLQNGGGVCFIRMMLVNGKKFIMLSDDDYVTEEQREEQYEEHLAHVANNAMLSSLSLSKIAQCTGGYFNTPECKHDTDGNLTQYFIDCYVPLEKFDGVKTLPDLAKLLENCDFSSESALQDAIKSL
ncbi:hypothetical protein VCHA53O466_140089 [Vibrio chagasii]|nr:hypothetical protein VCHA53O466_140089 [Vibrio chagasii]